MDFISHNLRTWAECYPTLLSPLHDAAARPLPELANPPAPAAATRSALILGLGDGSAIPQWTSQCPLLTHITIVVQHWGQLQSAFQCADWSALIRNNNVHWVIGITEESQLCNAMQSTIPATPDQNPAALQLYGADEAAYYQGVIRLYKAAAKTALGSALSWPEDALLGWRNFAANATLVAENPTIDTLKGCAAGVPGVVIASGPSLQQSLPLLKDLHTRAICCSVDNAYPVVLKAGCTPQFTAVLERRPALARYFTDMSATTATTLVAPPLVHPDTLAAWQGAYCFMHRSTAYTTRWFDAVSGHHLGHSVALLAFHTLRELGCDPIILVGQDLAFDPDSGQCYVANVHSSLEPKQQALKTAREQQSANPSVPGNSGKPIVTRPDFIRFLREFEQGIAAHPGCVINAIDPHYGAVIPGTTRRDPSAVLAALPPLSETVNATLNDALRLNPDQIKARRTTLQNRATETIKILRDDIAPDLLRAMDQLSDFLTQHLPGDWTAETDAAYRNFFAELERSDQKRLDEPAYRWCINMCQREAYLLSQDIRQLQSQGPLRDNIFAIFQRLQQYYSFVYTWIRRVQPQLAQLQDQDT